MTQKIITDLKSELELVLSRQLERMLVNQRLFKQLVMAMPLADHESGYGPEYDDQADDLSWFMHDGYVLGCCMAVRKMIDPDSSSISLINALEKIKKNVHLFPRAEFCKGYVEPNSPDHLEKALLEQGSKEFDLVTNGAAELTVSQIDDDLEAIKNATAPVKKLVNKVLAHTDKKFKGHMTHVELDHAIDVLRAIYNRYAILLGASRIDENTLANFNIKLPLAKVWPNLKKKDAN